MGNTESAQTQPEQPQPAGQEEIPPETVYPPPQHIPESQRLQLTAQELAKFNGTEGRPIYIAVRGLIFDVSIRPDLYGASEGGYHRLVGRDASRALATMQLQEEGTRIDDLEPMHLTTLQEWLDKYRTKYTVVGYLLGEDGSLTETAKEERERLLREEAAQQQDQDKNQNKDENSQDQDQDKNKDQEQSQQEVSNVKNESQNDAEKPQNGDGDGDGNADQSQQQKPQEQEQPPVDDVAVVVGDEV